jgi:hypothetical protein
MGLALSGISQVDSIAVEGGDYALNSTNGATVGSAWAAGGGHSELQ